VPVENSTEGAVGRTLDLMLQTELTIVGEIRLRIQQNLLAKAIPLDGVRKIYSHSQSLSQCVLWLARHLPAVPRIPVASNAEAARLAATEPGAAAIAGGDRRRDLSARCVGAAHRGRSEQHDTLLGARPAPGGPLGRR
jgi:Prephenate dehydratase